MDRMEKVTKKLLELQELQKSLVSRAAEKRREEQQKFRLEMSMALEEAVERNEPQAVTTYQYMSQLVQERRRVRKRNKVSTVSEQAKGKDSLGLPDDETDSSS